MFNREKIPSFSVLKLYFFSVYFPSFSMSFNFNMLTKTNFRLLAQKIKRDPVSKTSQKL